MVAGPWMRGMITQGDESTRLPIVDQHVGQFFHVVPGKRLLVALGMLDLLHRIDLAPGAPFLLCDLKYQHLGMLSKKGSPPLIVLLDADNFYPKALAGKQKVLLLRTSWLTLICFFSRSTGKHRPPLLRGRRLRPPGLHWEMPGQQVLEPRWSHQQQSQDPV